MSNLEKATLPSVSKPWLKYFREEVLAAELPRQSMFDFIYEINKDYPDDIALEYMDVDITYGEMFRHMEEVAKSLTALGVQPGEIVTIAMPNTPEFAYIAYAVNRVGAVMNLIHPLPGEKELHGYLDEVQSRFFFMFDGTYNIIKDTLKDTPVKQAIVISPAQSLNPVKRGLYKLAKFPKLDRSMCITWKEFIDLGKDAEARHYDKDPDTLAVISHTGGTTGEPKGVMLTDNAMNSVAFQIKVSAPTKASIRAGFIRQKGMLLVLPPFVNYSFTNGYHEGFAMGSRLGLIPSYDPTKFHEYQKRHHVSFSNFIPQYVQAMVNEKELRDMDLSSFELICSGGEAVDLDIERQFNELMEQTGAGMKLTKGYGCTEFTSVITFTYPEVNLPGTVGIPMPMVNVKIVEPDTTEELGIGQQGEVCATGPGLMMGYYNNQEATDDMIKIHSDGQRWLHLGDLGKIDEDGKLYITGRIKRIVMTKGLDGNPTKMFPDRIEKAIQKCEAVEVSCVIGVKDDERIHYPKAIVELKDKTMDPDAAREAIMKVCKENLPDYQVPDVIEFVDELPRTPRGKVDYRALEESDIKPAE